jgi:hypothetical protein
MVKPMAEPGNCIFRGFRDAVHSASLPERRRRETSFCHSGTSHTEPYDVDAAFMLV